MLLETLSTLPNYLAFILLALAELAAFMYVYVKFTPYPELALIRENNTAAAISFAGSILGFAVTIAMVVVNSHSLLDLTVWGVLGGVMQLICYLIVRRLVPTIATDIPAGKHAPAVFLGTVSLAVGLINGACMTY